VSCSSAGRSGDAAAVRDLGVFGVFGCFAEPCVGLGGAFRALGTSTGASSKASDAGAVAVVAAAAVVVALDSALLPGSRWATA